MWRAPRLPTSLGIVAASCVLAACSSSAPAPLSIQIVDPSATATVNASLTIQYASTGNPERIEAWIDGAKSRDLSGTTQDLLVVSSLAEGSHTLELRAFRGAEAAVSTRLQFIVDRTPPVLVARSPDNVAAHVANHEVATLTFSEPMKMKTGTFTAFRINPGDLSSSAPVPLSVTLDPDQRTFRIAPTNGWAGRPLPWPFQTINFHWNNGLTDLAGNPAAPVIWAWFVPAWLQEGNLVPGLYVPTPPAAAWGGGGLALGGTDGAGHSTVAQLVGGTWTPLGNLLEDLEADGTLSAAPALVGTSSALYGAATIVGPIGSGQRVVTWNGAGWSPVGGLLPQGTDATLAVSPDGGLSLAFRQGSSAQVMELDAGAWATVGAPLSVAEESDFPSRIRYMVDATGVRWLVTLDSAGAFGQFTVRDWNGSNWVGYAPSVTDAAPAETPALAIDPSGNPVVAYRTQAGGVTPVIRVLRTNGRSWSQVGGDIDPTPAGLYTGPGIGFDDDGTMLVAFPTGELNDTVLVTCRLVANAWVCEDNGLWPADRPDGPPTFFAGPGGPYLSMWLLGSSDIGAAVLAPNR